MRNLSLFSLLLLLQIISIDPLNADTPVAAELPNIVIILADDMGYGDVQVNNADSKIATPNLNQMAKDGMAFTDAHSPSAVCTPTRYSLLTGRYCWRTKLKKGVLGGYSKPLIKSDRSTIATMLKSKGYKTGAVGKWHLGMEMPLLKKGADVTRWENDPGIDFGGVISDSPIHHGFDYYFGVSASLDMAPYVFIRNDRFTALPTIQQPAEKFPHFIRKGPRAKDFVIDEVLDRIVGESASFIAESAKGEEPFFLYVPFTAPHKPTQPHERFRGTTGLGEYGDFVAQVDDAVGQILTAIDDAGVRDNTLVIYTSDNGSYMKLNKPGSDGAKVAGHVDDSSIQSFNPEQHRPNGLLRGTKADVWEAGHRVPFYVRWPGKVAAGSSCDEPICHTDLYATCAEVTGVDLTAGEAEDSVSLIPMTSDPAAKRGVPVIHHSVGGMFAIRDGQWKLVLGDGSGGREQPRGKPFAKPYTLFDLSSDLGETKDVAAENPDVVKRLESKADLIRENGRSVER